jgi:DUF2971 family protein
MEIWKEHDILFHYTTEAGVYGILETQTLHATHFKYLNDCTEMDRMVPKLREMMEPIVRNFYTLVARNSKGADAIEADGGTDKLIQRDTNSTIDGIYAITFGINRRYPFFQPFVASFCGHKKNSYERQNGLLSQWRAYGRDSGYAIVFDTKRLCDMIGKEAESHVYDIVQLCDVVYEGSQQRFKVEFAELIGAVEKAMPKFLRTGDTDFRPLYSPFMKSVSRYKHRGFAEEQEVRLLLSPTNRALSEEVEAKTAEGVNGREERTMKEVRFKQCSTPYIMIFDTVEQELPIQRIIVGPHRDKEARREKLSRYLGLTGRAIDVDCSATPLV